MSFKKFSDEEFQQIFMHIIGHSARDVTYKFALARFLLEYSETETETKVSFKQIARYFLKYYWPQICNSKLKQGARDEQSVDIKNKTKIVQIINQDFPEPYYPQTFDKISILQPENVENCIAKIENECFKVVTFAFQRIKEGNESKDVAPMFFEYKVTGFKKSRPDQLYVDQNYGIVINPHALDFFKRFNVLLKKSVIFEWAKYLEPYNSGYPEIIRSIESEYELRNLSTERKWLQTIQKNCFYCDQPLEKFENSEIHVEHIIPYSYLKHNKMWNLTLACKNCNCKKLGALPKPKQVWMEKIFERNKKFRKKILKLDQHLSELGDSFENKMNISYDLAKNQGFIEKQMP